jgi:hypothetical protein
MNEQAEQLDKNEEPKDDDVQGHRLVNEQLEEADVEAHQFEQVEQVEQVE